MVGGHHKYSKGSIADHDAMSPITSPNDDDITMVVVEEVRESLTVTRRGASCSEQTKVGK